MMSPGVLKKRTILFTSGLLVFIVISLGLGERAVSDVVTTWGLVEKSAGPEKTETADFNDGSVVYVRVKSGNKSGGSSNPNDVKISGGGPGIFITIIVYDDGTFPDDDSDDKYYWGKFTLREGDGSGTHDDIIEVKDTEIAEIESDIGVDGVGTVDITAAYSTFSDHTSPGIVSLSVNPSTFSPNGDGIDDTTTISFALGDESSSLYTRIEVRDSDEEIVRNLLVPKDSDNPLSTGSYSKIWDGKDGVGVRVSDATYTIHIISLDEDVNSSLRTIDVIIVDTEIAEVLEVNVSPGTISPENADGNYDSTKITFKAMHFEGGLTFKIIKDSTQYRDLSSNINWETDHWAVSWDGKNEGGIIVDDGDYTCEIVATNASSVSTTDTTGTVSVDNTPPPAPTNLSAMAIAGGSIKLTWTASSPETDVSQYNIYRATSSGAQNYSSPTYTVSSGTATYTDTSTIDGVTYYYVVRAQDAVSNIETNTNEASAIASATGPSFSSITSDKSAYKDGDTITLTVTLDNHNTGCTLTANFSNIDDQYATGGESVVNWGTDGVDNDGDGHIDNLAEQGVYVISYLISLVNTRADGSHDGHVDNPAEQGVYVITYLISTVNGRSDASYSVSVTATDGAGNSASSSISLTLDNTAPSGFISINNDAAYTNSRTVTLTLSATNATQMQFSNDASSWSDWEDYSTTKSWTLSSGDGKKKVYVKFKDGAGNVSEIYSDNIILDRTPPTAS
ncbi:MAG: hypothetical protein GH145_04130, partial [Firmicutes bacterium]|nr:hypothetical protein [Bacillota bacterium]